MTFLFFNTLIRACFWFPLSCVASRLGGYTVWPSLRWIFSNICSMGGCTFSWSRGIGTRKTFSIMKRYVHIKLPRKWQCFYFFLLKKSKHFNCFARLPLKGYRFWPQRQQAGLIPPSKCGQIWRCPNTSGDFHLRGCVGLWRKSHLLFTGQADGWRTEGNCHLSRLLHISKGKNFRRATSICTDAIYILMWHTVYISGVYLHFNDVNQSTEKKSDYKLFQANVLGMVQDIADCLVWAQENGEKFSFDKVRLSSHIFSTEPRIMLHVG